jgi:cytochrome c biogenesis protein CcdA
VLFGVGLVIMYTLIAVTMALLGQRLTNFKFYMSLAGSMITLILGLNLLNYVFQVVEFPVSTKNYSKRIVHQFVGGKGYLGAIVLGIIFSAVKLPCAAPALVVILTQIVDKGDLFYGFVLIAAFSVGVLLPFIFIGLVSGGTTDVAKKVRWSGFFRLLVWGGGGIIVLAVSAWVLYTAFDLLPVVTDTHFLVTLAAFALTAMFIVYALIMWRRTGPRTDIESEAASYFEED